MFPAPQPSTATCLFVRPGRQSGQATLELALCLPVLALLLGALVEIGMLAGDQARLWHAAREAARAAAVDPEASAAQHAAEASGLEGVAVNVSPEPTYRIQGEPVTVELAYRPRGSVPLVGRLFELVELQARVTARIEQP